MDSEVIKLSGSFHLYCTLSGSLTIITPIFKECCKKWQIRRSRVISNLHFSELHLICHSEKDRSVEGEMRQFVIYEQTLTARRHHFLIKVLLQCKKASFWGFCIQITKKFATSYKRKVGYRRLNVNNFACGPISSSSWSATWSCSPGSDGREQVAHLRSWEKAGKLGYPNTPIGDEQVGA